MLQLLKLPDGTVKVLVEGGRARAIASFTDKPSFFEAQRRSTLEEAPAIRAEVEALARAVVAQFEQLRQAQQEGAARGRWSRSTRSTSRPSSPTRSPRTWR